MVSADVLASETARGPIRPSGPDGPVPRATVYRSARSPWCFRSRSIPPGRWSVRTFLFLTEDGKELMVDYNLIQSIGIDEQEAEELIRQAFGERVAGGDMDTLLKEDMQEFKVGNILKGRVVGKAGDDVVVDVGLKSEGLDQQERVRQLRGHRDRRQDRGRSSSSSRTRPASSSSPSARPTASAAGSGSSRAKSEGDVVEGRCMRKIKGGLLVDIGVPVFLPGVAGRHPPARRHRRVHRQDDSRVRSSRSTRSGATSSSAAASSSRRSASRPSGGCSTRSRKAIWSRASSRTSPTSARSSTSAASTACCTSPT